MSERLEERLGARMALWAGNLADGPRFSADEIVLAARTVAGRRRVAGLLSVAAVVVALIAVTATLATNGRAAPFPPSTTPTRPTASAPSGLPAASFGLDVLTDGVIVRPDGSRVRPDLPAGVRAVQAIGVPSGWVVLTERTEGPFELWFAATVGAPVYVGRTFGNFEVSADGKVLVVTGLSPDPTTVAAYELPSLRKVRDTTAELGMGPLVLGISGDRVLLKGASGDSSPSGAAVWNLRTGGLRRASDSVHALGISRDGTVLRLVRQTGASAKDIVGGCLDAVPLTDTLAISNSGVCRADLAAPYVAGGISPDGSWVVLTTAAGEKEPRTMVLRSADLHSGRWSPAALDGPAGATALFWDTDSTFIALDAASQTTRYLRCAVTQRCVELALPAGSTDLEPVPVPRRGA